MKYDDNNIFAKILRGEIPCDKIYEDDYVLSFYDVNPQKKIHALIIPKGTRAYILVKCPQECTHTVLHTTKVVTWPSLQIRAIAYYIVKV
mgnify:CR=1 FL=1